MKVLVINAGSSSLKYQLINMENQHVLAKGNCERIGAGGAITHKTDAANLQYETSFPSHREAFLEVVKVLTSGEGKVIEDVKEIAAVGHRVLHGSEVYKVSTLITDKVIEDIESFSELGPLHNPPQAAAMRACRSVFGADTPMVAVFDTSFHQTMPEKAYMYGIPYEYYEKYHIRKYGFHGTSHRYVSGHYLEITGKKPEGTRVIVCHLGNGSSITAVKDGKCVDTTMGFTPLDGLLMGTRSGAVDPSVLTYLANKENLSPDEMSGILNKKSGFLGVSGLSSDARDLVNASKEGHHRAKLACDMVRYQIKKYIGSYAAAMGGVDAVLFTGGIGENSGELRAECCEELQFMGLWLDEKENDYNTGSDHKISAADSPVEVWVIPTNEELAIALDTVEIIGK
ncbi:MAG: acetate kinase [Provencibacterium sp.]|jgi:acetate kinase|nr:acetate kinase [Provencibacterium sp.]